MTAAHTASYAYGAPLLPPLLAMLFIALLALYGWRHRKVPGAVPFTAACLFGLGWSLGSILSGAAQDAHDKIFWLRFATAWQLPLVTAGTCFALQYAGLGRWLTRRVVIALAVPPILFAAAILTDGLHHLAWSGLTVIGGTVREVYGPLIRANLTYSYVLFALNVSVLLWLFVHSPRYRAPVALMVLAQVGARVTFELGVVRSFFPPAWDPHLFVLLVTFGVYGIALFGYHALDPLPDARKATLETMRDGMVVVGLEGRVVDLNPGAERALGRRREDVLAHPLTDVLPLGEAGSDAAATGDAIIELDDPGGSPRRYLVETTPLGDQRGRPLGLLILLHDVTEQQRAQACLLEQERVVATLQERERLARELHDSVGQVLGYLSLQAQTAGKRLRDGDAGKAQELLARLASVAQHAHADVRESILALHGAPSADWTFLPALRRYLEDFETQYGVATELEVDDVTDDSFPPQTGVQLLRVIQEAMTNARRHGHADTISIMLERRGDETHITVADDGDGFDPVVFADDGDGHFGLGFMRDRMAQIAGAVTIDSGTGAGTRVHLTAPLGAGQEEAG
jgi:PAS domain S-box-containing protein